MGFLYYQFYFSLFTRLPPPSLGRASKNRNEGYADSVGYRVRREVYQTFLKVVVWGKLWKMIGDDGEVDEVSVCRSIMVCTHSFRLLQLGLTQQKRRLTGFQYSFLYLPSANQVDDTGKVSSPLPWPQNTILTSSHRKNTFPGFSIPSTTNPPYPSPRPNSKPFQAATY